MTEHHTLTIGDACKKHSVNRSTLTSWVKNEKVASEKRLIGRKPIHFINEQSLLEQMERSKATTNKPVEKPAPPPKTEGKPELNPEQEAKPDPNESRKSETDSGKKSDTRKRPRSNLAVTRAKDAMRSLDQDELIRVNNWLARRILTKSQPARKQSEPPW